MNDTLLCKIVSFSWKLFWMDSYNVYCFLQISYCNQTYIHDGKHSDCFPRCWSCKAARSEVIHDIFVYLQPASSEEGKTCLPCQWHKGSFCTRNDCLVSAMCTLLKKFHTVPLSAWEGEKAQSQRERVKMILLELFFVEQIQFLREKSVVLI